MITSCGCVSETFEPIRSHLLYNYQKGQNSTSLGKSLSFIGIRTYGIGGKGYRAVSI